MILPINGRIAIIDNNIAEVTPLFSVLSKNRIPYIFFQGDEVDALPDTNSQPNDIRLVFLDLNLLGQATPNKKDIISQVSGVLDRIISPNNYPYGIIAWSKQENQYLEDVTQHLNTHITFENRRPIFVEPFVKSDFFSLSGEMIPGVNNDLILDRTIDIFKRHQSYSSLLFWENKIHDSSNDVLREIFGPNHSDWETHSSTILSKLSEAYLGKKHKKEALVPHQIRGSLSAFNEVFLDNLESNLHDENDDSFLSSLDYFQHAREITDDSISKKINEKLILSRTNLNLEQTGVVLLDDREDSGTHKDLLNNVLDRKSITKENPTTEKDEKKIKKHEENVVSAKRKEIKQSIEQIFINITPLCDFVQKKQKNSRMVQGIIIDSKFIDYILVNEAIYISPIFYDSRRGAERVFVLDFRFFFAVMKPENIKVKFIKPIFRLRSSVVAEIQSRVARHISRQGILFL